MHSPSYFKIAMKEQVQITQLHNDALFQLWGNCVLTASWTQCFLGSYLDLQIYESLSNLYKYLFNKYILAQASWSDAHVCNQRDSMIPQAILTQEIPRPAFENTALDFQPFPT